MKAWAVVFGLGVMCVLAACGESESSFAPNGALGDSAGSPSADAPLSGASDETRAAIGDAHTRFMTEMFANDGAQPNLPDQIKLIEELTTGAQYQRSYDAAVHNAETGRALVGPGYKSKIVNIETRGDYAVVLDCSLKQSELHSPEGTVIVAADDFFEFRTTKLDNVDGVWKVSDFVTQGNVRCYPEQY